MSQDVVDVVIVGAGPTGLTLAAQLRAFGVGFRIVDRQLDRVHESRALAMQPCTLEVLRGLGFAQALVQRGNDALRLQMHFGARVVGMPLFDVGLEDTAYPFLLFISQAETEAIMNEHLLAHGIAVERGVELLAYSASREEVLCTLRLHDGTTEQVRARYLVGCDGAHSSVRRGAGIPFEGAAYPQTFALGDVEIDGELEQGAAHGFVGPQGLLLIFPLGRPTTWRVMGMRPPPRDQAGREPEADELSLADLQAICDAFTDGTLRLRDPAWLSYFRLQHRQAVRYRNGPVFLAGDAAHVHSPAGAQGMNTGIQDAWNLGWKLALVTRERANAALLDSYEPERLPVGRFVLRFSDRASSIAISESRLVRLLRTQLAPRILPLLLRFARGRAYGFRTISQLGISYRTSPAVEEGRPRLGSGPRAGDRLPDLRIERDGRECWLHEALTPLAFQLLLCGPVEWSTDDVARLRKRYGALVAVHRLAGEAAPGVLHDPNGSVLTRLGAKQPAQYLVRPDGHIGFRSGATDLRAAESYLERWLRAPSTP